MIAGEPRSGWSTGCRYPDPIRYKLNHVSDDDGADQGWRTQDHKVVMREAFEDTDGVGYRIQVILNQRFTPLLRIDPCDTRMQRTVREASLVAAEGVCR
jgi:hypothetical protein